MSSNASTKGGRGKTKSTKSVSRSHKVDLQFPIKHIARFFKVGKFIECVSTDALVYLSTVFEYLAAKLAGNAVRDNKKNRIIP